MDQLTELVIDRKKDLPFTKNGEPLKVRPMPLSLAMQIGSVDDNKVEVETGILAKIIARCVLMPDGKPAFTEDEVLDGDIDAMMPLFNAVIGAFTPEEAEKNS